MKKTISILLILFIVGTAAGFTSPPTARAGHWFEVTAWITARDNTCKLIIEGTTERQVRSKARWLATMAGHHSTNTWQISSIRSLNTSGYVASRDGEQWYDYYVYNSETREIQQVVVKGDRPGGDDSSRLNPGMLVVTYLENNIWSNTDMHYWGSINRMIIVDRSDSAVPHRINFPAFDVEQQRPRLSQSVNEDTLSLSWGQVSNSTSYEYQTSFGGGDWSGSSRTNDTSANFSGIFGDDTINVRVRSVREHEGFDTVVSDWAYTGLVRTGYRAELSVVSVVPDFSHIKIQYSAPSSIFSNVTVHIEDAVDWVNAIEQELEIPPNSMATRTHYFRQLRHSHRYRVTITAEGINHANDCEWEQIITTLEPELEYEVTAGKTWLEVDFEPQDYFNQYQVYIYDYDAGYYRNNHWRHRDIYLDRDGADIRIEGLTEGTEYMLRLYGKFVESGNYRIPDLEVETLTDPPPVEQPRLKHYKVELELSNGRFNVIKQTHEVDAYDSDSAGIFAIAKAQEVEKYRDDFDIRIVSVTVVPFYNDGLRPAVKPALPSALSSPAQSLTPSSPSSGSTSAPSSNNTLRTLRPVKKK